jgi:hypothetical protein
MKKLLGQENAARQTDVRICALNVSKSHTQVASIPEPHSNQVVLISDDNRDISNREIIPHDFNIPFDEGLAVNLQQNFGDAFRLGISSTTGPGSWN